MLSIKIDRPLHWFDKVFEETVRQGLQYFAKSQLT
jgi:hypothetical protein